MDSVTPPGTPLEVPPELRALLNPAEPIWEGHSREARRWQASSLDVFFLSFLRRVGRFGYFTLGPITIDVRLIEDLVERTVVPSAEPDPPFGEQMTRFSTCSHTRCNAAGAAVSTTSTSSSP